MTTVLAALVFSATVEAMTETPEVVDNVAVAGMVAVAVTVPAVEAVADAVLAAAWQFADWI